MTTAAQRRLWSGWTIPPARPVTPTWRSTTTRVFPSRSPLSRIRSLTSTPIRTTIRNSALSRNKKDPGRLKFNHALHRARGYTLEPNGKISHLPRSRQRERSRYGWNPTLPLETPVPPLEDCNSCHRLDSDEYAASGTRSQTAGSVVPARMARGVHAAGDLRKSLPRLPSARIRFQEPGPRGTAWALAGRGSRRAPPVLSSTSGQRRSGVAAPVRSAPSQTRASRRARTSSQVGRAVDAKVLTAVRILFGAGVSDEAMRAPPAPARKKRLCRVPSSSPVAGSVGSSRRDP